MRTKQDFINELTEEERLIYNSYNWMFASIDYNYRGSSKNFDLDIDGCTLKEAIDLLIEKSKVMDIENSTIVIEEYRAYIRTILKESDEVKNKRIELDEKKIKTKIKEFISKYEQIEVQNQELKKENERLMMELTKLKS